ncbi:hypothetical protein N2152v2_000807 [Parachlorella kessleri]
MDELRIAVSRCPFLHKVCAAQGEGVAMQIAIRPFSHAVPGGQPASSDFSASIEASARLFHGSNGVVPLKRFADEQQQAPAAGLTGQHGGCPYHRAASLKEGHLSTSEAAGPSLMLTGSLVSPAEPKQQAAVVQPVRGLPLASMSLSAFGFLPDPGEFFRRAARPRKPQQQQHKKPQQQQQRSSTSHAGGGTGQRTGGGAGGQCPLRKFFGPLGGLLPLTASGRLECPSAIVKMRAVVAGLKPVRDLRPQALPVRAVAMGTTAVLANVPCGMWREHTRKFSPEWFVAVHATIPFVAMLRKAVLMPKWAILLTILGSVAGQQVGAKLERKRIELAQHSRHKADSSNGAPKPCRDEALGGLRGGMGVAGLPHLLGWQHAGTPVAAS